MWIGIVTFLAALVGGCVQQQDGGDSAASGINCKPWWQRNPLTWFTQAKNAATVSEYDTFNAYVGPNLVLIRPYDEVSYDFAGAVPELSDAQLAELITGSGRIDMPLATHALKSLWAKAAVSPVDDRKGRMVALSMGDGGRGVLFNMSPKPDERGTFVGLSADSKRPLRVVFQLLGLHPDDSTYAAGSPWPVAAQEATFRADDGYTVTGRFPVVARVSPAVAGDIMVALAHHLELVIEANPQLGPVLYPYRIVYFP